MVSSNAIGTDLDSSWDFVNGDLVLVSNEDNILQSIRNRLNTKLESLNLFYEEYGSKLYGFLGWRAIDSTLDFIKIEIEETLKQDPRCTNNEIDIYFDDGIKIDLTINFDDANLTFNLVLEDNYTINLSKNEVTVKDIEVDEE